MTVHESSEQKNEIIVTSPKYKEVEESGNNAFHFKPNSNYFTICIYALVFVITAAIIIFAIIKWDSTIGILNSILGSLTPFIIAFFIAYILNPLVHSIDRLLERYLYKDRCIRARKLTSIGVTYLIVFAIIGIIIFYITPEIIHSTKDIQAAYNSVDVTKIQDTITETMDNIQDKYPQIDFDFIKDKVTDSIPNLMKQGTTILSNLFPMLLNLSVSIVKTIFNILLAIVISCYMLSDKKQLSKNSKRVVFACMKKEHALAFMDTLRECDNIFSKFFIGKALDSFIIGCICFVLMKILQLPYTTLISVIVGITNMIPYFGPFIGAVPGVLIYLFINPIQALIFTIMIFVLQQFDGLYLGPKILGGSTGLTPLWVIFAITVGGAYAGVLGMFLGVPIVAVIAYLLDTWLNNRLRKKNISVDD